MDTDSSEQKWSLDANFIFLRENPIKSIRVVGKIRVNRETGSTRIFAFGLSINCGFLETLDIDSDDQRCSCK